MHIITRLNFAIYLLVLSDLLAQFRSLFPRPPPRSPAREQRLRLSARARAESATCFEKVDQRGHPSYGLRARRSQ